MSHSLQSRLFLNGLVIVLLGMGLAGILFWQAAENLYIDTQKENLLAQAELTAAALQGQQLPVAPVEPYSQLSNVQPGFHTRVLGREGTVVIGLPLAAGGQAVQMPAAEDYAVVSPQDLLVRPEIISARQGQAAVEVRAVLDGQRRVMYAAAPILAEDGSVNGLVYLAVPLPRADCRRGSWFNWYWRVWRRLYWRCWPELCLPGVSPDRFLPSRQGQPPSAKVI